METDREKHRRERRGVALMHLGHLLTVAIRHYPNDYPSQRDLSDAHRAVLMCLEDFEHEANEAERHAQA